MADGYISQITLPNNQTYDLKDKNAVFPVQYTTWTIASGSTSTTITKTGKYFADTYVISLVVSSGENNLNGPITWETSSNKLKITTSAATSGVVSGYAITARAVSL